MIQKSLCEFGIDEPLLFGERIALTFFYDDTKENQFQQNQERF